LFSLAVYWTFNNEIFGYFNYYTNQRSVLHCLALCCNFQDHSLRHTRRYHTRSINIAIPTISIIPVSQFLLPDINCHWHPKIKSNYTTQDITQADVTIHSTLAKGKVHPVTCHKGPERAQRCNSTLALTSAPGGGGWSMPRTSRFTPR
jgi:hypothetical protein